MPQHHLASPERGWVNKYKPEKSTATQGSANGTVSGPLGAAGPGVFTATGAGSTTTIVGASANLATGVNVMRVGERFVLFNSSGVRKENTIFRVTAHNGTTTVTFTPAAAAATASGDVARLVSADAFVDNDSLDARLLQAGFTQTKLDSMTQNDKVYAVRQADDPRSVL